MTTLYVVFAAGIQAGLIEKITGTAFWLKFGFASSLMLSGLIITIKVAKPRNAPSHYFILAMAAPVLVIWTMAAWALTHPSTYSVSEMVEGVTWQVCSIRIILLSVPTFVAVFWSLTHMAPTRLRFAGFTAGLFSGGLAACIYTLTCIEYSPVFIGVWYLLGIFVPAAVGALLGKSLLRW